MSAAAMPGQSRPRGTKRVRRAIAALPIAGALALGAAATGAGWTVGAAMPTARSELAAAALDGRIYVAGGLAQFGATRAFEIYDPAADRWEKLAPLPGPLHHFGMAALGGRIYVSGGYGGISFTPDKAAVWAYDPAADRWTRRADLPAPRAAHAMAALGDRLYVVGGVGPRPAELLVYDPAADRWAVVPAPLPTPREHLAAVALDGRLYVVGGRRRDQGNLAVLEVFDSQRQAW